MSTVNDVGPPRQRRFGEPPMSTVDSTRQGIGEYQPRPFSRQPDEPRFKEPPMPNAARRQRFGEPPRQDYSNRQEQRKWWEEISPATATQAEVPRATTKQTEVRRETFEPEAPEIESPMPRQEASPMTRVNEAEVVDAIIEEASDTTTEEESTESAQETATLDEAPVCIWDTPFPIVVQGSELRTWSFEDDSIERVQVFLRSEDSSPLKANVNLWHGPDDTPQKMTVFIKDGSTHPFSAVMETPVGHNSVAIENTSRIGVDMRAAVVASDFGNGSHGFGPLSDKLDDMEPEEKQMDGGEERTWPVASHVDSVQVLLRTYKRPLYAQIELLQTSDMVTQLVEIYTEDGLERPFYIVIETPGEENVVRVVNTAPEGFPMDAVVEPHSINYDALSEKKKSI